MDFKILACRLAQVIFIDQKLKEGQKNTHILAQQSSFFSPLPFPALIIFSGEYLMTRTHCDSVLGSEVNSKP